LRQAIGATAAERCGRATAPGDRPPQYRAAQSRGKGVWSSPAVRWLPGRGARRVYRGIGLTELADAVGHCRHSPFVPSFPSCGRGRGTVRAPPATMDLPPRRSPERAPCQGESVNRSELLSLTARREGRGARRSGLCRRKSLTSRLPGPLTTSAPMRAPRTNKLEAVRTDPRPPGGGCPTASLHGRRPAEGSHLSR
jgi:hypothetical protein